MVAKKVAHTLKGLTPLIKNVVWTAVVVVALVVFYMFLFSLVGLKNFVQLINGLVWPTVFVIALVVFRKPLSDFLRGIALRATKFTITQFFAFELSPSEVPRPKIDQFLLELQSFASGSGLVGAAGPSGQSFLSQLLKDSKALDYLIIDLGGGDRWLTSRLFIFTVMLQRLRGLRCIVFVETRGDIRHKFLATATPNEIRQALADHYPWLEKAYIGAHTTKFGDVPPGVGDAMQSFLGQQKDRLDRIRLIKALDNVGVDAFVTSFLVSVQIDPSQVPSQNVTTPPDASGEWVFLEKRQFWEHAKWINRDGLKSDLGDSLQDSDGAWLKDPPGIPEARRVQAILCRKCPFVALVDEDRAFKSLIDREALLEQVATRVGTASDDQ